MSQRSMWTGEVFEIMRLKELRISKGVSQKEVAISIGSSSLNYSRYEREEREPDIQTLKALSKYYKVSIDYIVSNDIITETR